MPRADLLALTEDDLAALTNRGTVKRALRELDDAAMDCQIDESPAGDVKFAWSDGSECEVPAGASLKEARCSSGGGGISRHLIRSVLLYQRRQEQQVSSAPVMPWDPGFVFTDEMLEQHFRKADVARARQRFESGVLVELVRSVKPLARFLDDPCVLRFMVPGDLRYLHADCSPQMLSVFVPMAVWSFRQLPVDSSSGLISTQKKPLPVPVEMIAELEKLLHDCAASGLATAGDVWKQRIMRLQEQLRREGLVWPSEILADLVEEYERYHEHDARFSIDRTVDLMGELLIRCDAITSGSQEIPQVLVRGTGADRVSEIAAARLIGLGCGVTASRKCTTITAYLQDVDTGSVSALMRDFANVEEGNSSPKDFSTLAQTPVARGITIAGLGGGQLLVKSAKRTPSQRLVLPRTGVSVNPQQYAWEKLRPPLLCENFAELTAILATLPPPSLRPRRATEDLFAVAVDQVESHHFAAAEQAVTATLLDAAGGRAMLLHPFAFRASEGTQLLLDWFARDDARLKFVAGHARPSTAGLVIHPIAAVFEADGKRTCVQPWIDSRTSAGKAGAAATSTAAAPISPLLSALQTWQTALGELWLMGTRRVTPQLLAQWHESVQRLEACGLIRLAESAGQLRDQIALRLSQADYTGQTAASQLLYCSTLSRLAIESL